MADTPTLPEVTVTGDIPIFGDPFAADSAGLVDYLGGLSLNEYAAKQSEITAAATAVPLIPELLPEVVVTAGKTAVKAVTSQLTPLGLALSFFTPTPVASQDQENILLDQYNAWRGFYAGLDIGTPALPQSPALPASTVTPEVVALPEVTVSPPMPQTPTRTIYPPDLIIPFLTDFAPVPIDTPLPEPEVFPADAPPAPPPTRAPAIPGAVPIGLPVGTITIERDIPWWENVPAVAVPTPFPSPPSVDFVPLLPEVPFDQPIRTQPDVSVPSRPDVATDRTGGSVRDALADTNLSSIRGDLALDLAVPTPSAVRPVELAPTLDLGTDLSPAFAQPLPFASPFAQPATDAGSVTRTPTRTREDECECAKKKPKKKSKPRDVCYRGTYRQNSRGITYNRLEEIPCEPKRAVSKRETSRKRKTPTWQDTLDQVFGRFQP